MDRHLLRHGPRGDQHRDTGASRLDARGPDSHRGPRRGCVPGGHAGDRVRASSTGAAATSLGGYGSVLRARERPPELSARADTELREHLVQVVLDGARADEQQGGYLRVRASLGREPGDLRLLRGELVDRLDGTLAHRLAGGRKLALSALGERSRAHSAEHLVGRAQLLARVDAAVFATQPLAVQKAAAREFERRAAAREALDRFAVERLVVAQQPPAARFDPERPFGAARPRTFAQAAAAATASSGRPPRTPASTSSTRARP